MKSTTLITLAVGALVGAMIAENSSKISRLINKGKSTIKAKFKDMQEN